MSKYDISLSATLDAHTDVPFDGDILKRREFIETIAQALYNRHEQFPRWPESVRQFYACYDLNFQGFAKAAFNAPHLIAVAHTAFERLGRLEAAALCRRAIDLQSAEFASQIAKGFSGGETIEAALAHIDESALAELDRDPPREFWVDGALQQLVQQHRADFASVDGLG
jgi:hypothetical protein